MINIEPLDLPGAAAPEVLLIAGSRPEAARLAPVAAAMGDSGRVNAVTVACGANPMRVHETFEVLGAPPGITLLLGSAAFGGPSGPVAVAAALAVRLDELMLERVPAAVLVSGGGVAALVAAQVAFYRKIPLVHLYTGTDVDDLLCPFPEEGNRRVIGQLTSLFLHTRGHGTLCNVAGPNSVVVGDTLAAVAPGDADLAALAARARAGEVRIGLLDASSPPIVAAAAQLLTRNPELELVLIDAPPPPTDPGADEDPVLAWLCGHPRIHTVDRDELVDVLGIVAVSTFAASDRPYRYYDVLACGVPAVLVDSTGEAADTLDPSWIAAVAPEVDAVFAAMAGLLSRSSQRPLAPAGAAAARRVEHAVAWMLGLARDPVPTSNPATAL